MEFVESSILVGTDNDGYHTTEKQIINDSTLKQQIKNKQSELNRSGLSLADQLALNKQTADELYREKFEYGKQHKLSSEDISWLKQQADIEKQELSKQREAELVEQLQFKRAAAERQKLLQHNQNLNNQHHTNTSNSPLLNSAPLSNILSNASIKVKKRTSIDNTNHIDTESMNKKPRDDKHNDADQQHTQSTESNRSNPPASSVAHPLVSYASSDDD